MNICVPVKFAFGDTGTLVTSNSTQRETLVVLDNNGLKIRADTSHVLSSCEYNNYSFLRGWNSKDISEYIHFKVHTSEKIS